MAVVDDTNQVTKELAEAFAAVLKRWLTPAQFVQMQRANVQNVSTLNCASHDYCDANMAMLAAFVVVLKREPTFRKTPVGAASEDEDRTLWNLAWEYALRKLLTAGGEQVNGR